MSVEKVRQHLDQWGLAEAILEFDSSSATVELAAEAVGVSPARIAKTLCFQMDDHCLLVVAAGDARVDSKKFRRSFGMKPKMLSPEEVKRLTGHEVGGVSPFGLADPSIPIYLDQSLRRFDTVFPACGSHSNAIEMTCDTLETICHHSEWIDVCKDWQSASE